MIHYDFSQFDVLKDDYSVVIIRSEMINVYNTKKTLTLWWAGYM